MSLYVCPECGHKDNTSGSGYYEQRRSGVEAPLCSSCNPAVDVSVVRAMNLLAT